MKTAHFSEKPMKKPHENYDFFQSLVMYFGNSYCDTSHLVLDYYLFRDLW